MRLQDSGPLQIDGVVKGFYFVYEKPSENKDNNIFMLQIHDVNLNLLKSKNITVPSKYSVALVSTNGKSILVEFSDLSTTYLIKAYSFQGEQIFTRSVTWDRFESFMNQMGKPLAIHPVTGFGYVHYLYVHEKQKEPSYQINFYSEDNERIPNWTIHGHSESAELVSHLGADSAFVYYVRMSGKSLKQRNLDVALIKINIRTGKQVYEVPLQTPENNYLPFVAYTAKDGNARIIGRYFNTEDSPTADKELGFALLELDEKGQIIKKNLQPYALEEENLRPYFEELIQLPNGKTIAIAELYGSRVDAAGLLLGGAPMKYIVEDLLVYEFDQEFNLVQQKRYDKFKSNIELPGIMVGNPLLILNMFKAWGGFDYSYYQFSGSGDEMAIGYLDYERRKNEKNNTVLATVFITDKGFSTDKFDLPYDADYTKIIPGAFGNVVVLEYNQKEKQLKIYAKNLNY
jgi:hypothetical protein